MGFILSIALGIFIVILLIPIIGAILELIGDIISAIVKAYGSCDDLIVKQEDGVIKVESFHHDGRNRFEIRPLTEHGKQALENDCDGEPISCQLTDEMVGKYEGYLY